MWGGGVKILLVGWGGLSFFVDLSNFVGGGDEVCILDGGEVNRTGPRGWLGGGGGVRRGVGGVGATGSLAQCESSR